MHESSLELTPDIEYNSSSSPLLPSTTSKQNPKQIPQITEYKNATYYGKYDSLKLQQGIGIVAYDNGDILVGYFRSGSLRGYFMYFVAGIQEGSWWVYGVYEEDRMTGWGYVYGRDHRAVRVLFKHGRVMADARYHNGVKTGIANNYGSIKQTIEFSNISSPRINIRPPPPGKPSQNQHTFLKPTDFLETYFALNTSSLSESDILIPQSSTSFVQTQFQIFEIGNKQMFYGNVQNNKPQGLGIIFVDQWPVCYGNFVNGQLHGLGRVQQNRFMVLDGVFQKSCLKDGWVLDLQENLTCYGTLIEVNNKKELFKFSQQYSTIQIDKILKYRRRKHLQSLTYNNSHFFQIFHKIKSQFWAAHFETNYQQSFLSMPKQQNFIPSFISQISRIHDQNTHKSRVSGKSRENDTSSRVERDFIQLIKEYNENRSNFQKNSKAISIKLQQNQKTQQFDENYTKQNKVITYRPTKSPQHREINRSINKETIEFISANYEKKMTKNGSIHNINKISGQTTSQKSYQPPKTKPKAEQVHSAQPQTDRKIEKRLDLHKMYTKYLKKQL